MQGVFTSAQKLPTKRLLALGASVPGSSRGAGWALSPAGTGDTRAELRAGRANKT